MADIAGFGQHLTAAPRLLLASDAEDQGLCLVCGRGSVLFSCRDCGAGVHLACCQEVLPGEAAPSVPSLPYSQRPAGYLL